MKVQLIHRERQEPIIGFTLLFGKHKLQSALSSPWHMSTSQQKHTQNPGCKMLPYSLGLPWQHVPTFSQCGSSERFNLTASHGLVSYRSQKQQRWDSGGWYGEKCRVTEHTKASLYRSTVGVWWSRCASDTQMMGSYNDKSNIISSFEITELDVHLLWLSEVKRLCIKKGLSCHDFLTSDWWMINESW